MTNIVIPQHDSNLSALWLESIYNRYGAHIYSLCLRLLTKEKAAEVSTVDAFVRLWESANAQWDEPYSLSRLRVLAIEACRKRLRRRRFNTLNLRRALAGPRRTSSRRVSYLSCQ